MTYDTTNNAWEISNVNQLQFMAYDLVDSFELTQAIIASATSGWNSGVGFRPIGNDGANAGPWGPEYSQEHLTGKAIPSAP